MINKRAINEFLNQPRDNFLWVKKLTEKQLDTEIANLNYTPIIPLMKHQKAAFLAGVVYPSLCLWLSMGTGKTGICLELLNFFYQKGFLQGKTMIFAPTDEVVQSWESEIAKWNIDIPYTTLLGSTEEKWERYNIDSGIVIGTYVGIAYMVSTLQPAKKKDKNELVVDSSKLPRLLSGVEALIMDECFVGSTNVLCPEGNKPIRDIGYGDLVCTSFGFKKVKKQYKKSSNITVVITLENGKVIECTPNHPFFTDVGWVCAGDLEGRILCNEKALRSLCDLSDSSDELSGKERQKVLFSILFSEIKVQEGCSLEQRYPYATGVDTPDQAIVDRREEKTSVSSDDWKKPSCVEQRCSNDGSSEGKVKYLFESYEAWYSRGSSWWEWAWNDCSTTTSFDSIRKSMDTGAQHFIGRKASWLSSLLQGRFRLAREKDGNRDRWVQSSNHSWKNKGSEKGSEIDGIRVVSVEVKKRIHPIDVYTIEIEDCPHFFVDGYLVHNSTKIANHKNLSFKVCNAISRNCDVRYALAGRPFGRDPLQLWAQFFLTDRGETLSPHIGFYQEVFFHKKKLIWHPNAYEHVFNPKMQGQLTRITAHRSLSYDVEECVTLPELTRIKRYVDFPVETLVYYNNLIRDLIEAKGDVRVVKNVFLRLRTLSSGFLGMKDDDSGEKSEIAFDSNPKLDLLLDLIDEVPDDRKCIVFYDFTYSGRRISEELKKRKIKAGWLWSGTKNWAQMEKQFREDPKFKVLVINSKKGSYGLNLQHANYCFFYESPVSGIDRDQAEKRAHRTGQKHTVFMYDLLVRNSVDDKILNYQSEGRSLFQALVSDPAKVLKHANRNAV
jgi:hypothetical protein